MALKIKWNDDRVRAATTAILIIGRDRLHRGESSDLIAASLADYRAEPRRYKVNQAAEADTKGAGPLTNPEHIVYFRNLVAAIDGLYPKMTRAKRQFNSLLELDNWLVASLKNVR